MPSLQPTEEVELFYGEIVGQVVGGGAAINTFLENVVAFDAPIEVEFGGGLTLGAAPDLVMIVTFFNPGGSFDNTKQLRLRVMAAGEHTVRSRVTVGVEGNGRSNCTFAITVFNAAATDLTAGLVLNPHYVRVTQRLPENYRRG